MTRVMLLGASHSELPLISVCQGLGLEVVTVGRRTDDIGHRHSDLALSVDYSHADSVRVAYEETGCEYLVPGCNDFALLTASALAPELGLCGFDDLQVARQLHHKSSFRQVQSVLCLPCPSVREFPLSGGSESHEQLRFPVIVKPIDLSGGKGMSVVWNAADLDKALSLAQSASREQRIVVEEYLDGTMHGASFLIQEGRVEWRFYDDERYAPGSFMVEGTVAPDSLTPAQKGDIEAQVSLLAGELALVDGFLHTQFIQTESSGVLVEVTRRCAGDHYPVFATESSGFQYALAYVAPFLDRPLPRSDTNVGRPVSRRVLVAPRPGVVANITLNVLPGALLPSSQVWRPVGSSIMHPNQEKIGVAFSKFVSPEEMRCSTDALWGSEVVTLEM